MENKEDGLNLKKISKEELIEYLKQQKKNKEKQDKKIKKLEERYLKVFKRNKELTQNLNFFIDQFTENFIEEGVFLDKEEIEHKSFQTKLMEWKNGINKHRKVNEESEKQSLQVNHQEIEERDKQISQLKHLLLAKDDVIKELRQSIQEQENDNFNNLIEDLKGLSQPNDQDLQIQMQESDKTNIILELREQIRDLKKQVKKEMDLENGKLEFKDTFTQTEDQSQSLNDSSSHITTPNMEIVKEEKDHHQERDYVKDLLIKFFMYQKKKNNEKKKLIINVIYDVLKFTHDEKNEIDDIVFSKKFFFVQLNLR